MGNGMRKALCAAVALLMAVALGGACALAQTLEELRETATALAQTIEAHGRTIALDAQPEFPDVGGMGVYVATFGWEDQRTGPVVYVEPPPKRRGIVYRRMPRETYTPQTLPQDCRAINHPQTALEAVDTAWEVLAPLVDAAPGMTVAWREVTVMQPYFLYDKEAGEWGEQVVPEETGWYNFEYDVLLYGAPMLSGRPYIHDWESYNAENAWGDDTATARANTSVEIADGKTCVHATTMLPQVTKTLDESVDFAPLEPVYQVLSELAQEGLLRQVHSLRLGYLAFMYGERTQNDDGPYSKPYLLKPVWMCSAEVYSNAEDEPFDMGGGDVWRPEETVVFDAQTGEMIERARVVAYP